MSDHLDLAAIEARARDSLRCNVSAEDREETLALIARVRELELSADEAKARIRKLEEAWTALLAWRDDIEARSAEAHNVYQLEGGTRMGETVGKIVWCLTCGRIKAPRGRSVPAEMAGSRCDWECSGYRLDPIPGELWPGETRAEFGYPREERQ